MKRHIVDVGTAIDPRLHLKADGHLLNSKDSFKVTCRDNGKDDPPWKEWRKDGSAAIETTFTSLFSLLLLLF